MLQRVIYSSAALQDALCPQGDLDASPTAHFSDTAHLSSQATLAAEAEVLATSPAPGKLPGRCW